MNQIKYLIYACILLAFCTIAFYIFKTLSDTEIIKQNDSVAVYANTSEKPTNSIASKGKSLFQQNCQACHSLDKRVIGPALRGFTNRGPWVNKENIYKWITNPAAFIKKSPYAEGLKAEYGIVMQPFSELKREDVDEIIKYINSMPDTVPEYQP